MPPPPESIEIKRTFSYRCEIVLCEKTKKYKPRKLALKAKYVHETKNGITGQRLLKYEEYPYYSVSRYYLRWNIEWEPVRDCKWYFLSTDKGKERYGIDIQHTTDANQKCLRFIVSYFDTIGRPLRIYGMKENATHPGILQIVAVSKPFMMFNIDLDLNIECPICREFVDSSDAETSPICNHVFHHTCMERWREVDAKNSDAFLCCVCIDMQYLSVQSALNDPIYMEYFIKTKREKFGSHTGKAERFKKNIIKILQLIELFVHTDLSMDIIKY